MSTEEKYKDLLSTSIFNKNYTAYKSQFIGIDDKPYETKCVLCDIKFILPKNEKEFLTHLFKKHRLVIADVWNIASLKSYVHYWSVKFKEEPLTKFCTTMLMDCTPDGKPSKNERYFLLSDCISEDKILRDEIHQAKLEWILSEQTRERTDTNFKRGCIFCRMEFSGLRITYIKHLAQKHNLYLGKPDNLVFIDEFLDKIQTTIDNLICIYCEKLFKDRTVLKEHMRKKLHKRINPNNKEYDKFYINNYLEPGKSLKSKQVKVVNYIKRQIHLQKCVFCEMKVDNILEHMKKENHFKIPSPKTWDQPEFYFPMHENESFLYNLDTSSTSDEENDFENITEATYETVIKTK
ncbi:zinc finger protein 277 [Apis dorsata]|uniref:zinc finger protein 277 n=1 Tax=Apis dorsata TaxID=7462 RepID=UPI0012937990|nr:zinc finger protein 277 [Apis dorsata]